MPLMAKAKLPFTCDHFLSGIASPRILKLMKTPALRNATMERIKACVKSAQIYHSLNLLVGFPGETEERLSNVADF